MSDGTSKGPLPPISECRPRLASTLRHLARYCRTPDLLPDAAVTRNTLVVRPTLIPLTVKRERLTTEQQAEAQEHADAELDPVLLDEDALAKKLAKAWELAKDDDHNGFMELYRGVPGLSVGRTWLLPSVRITRALT